MSGEPDHDHDHDHHGHTHQVEAEPGPVDPGRERRWHLAVIVGAVVALLSWIAWPTVHLLTVERGLRRISASPSLLGFTLGIAAATWLLTVTPEPRPAGAHRAGQIALRIMGSLGASLGVASYALGRGSIFIELVAFPLAVVMLLLGFAYLGRLARLVGRARLANLADLAGVVLPLFWIAGQTLGSNPGPLVWGPGLAGMIVGGLVLGGIAVSYAMPRPSEA